MPLIKNNLYGLISENGRIHLSAAYLKKHAKTFKKITATRFAIIIGSHMKAPYSSEFKV
jgi:hypothetical protein